MRRLLTYMVLTVAVFATACTSDFGAGDSGPSVDTDKRNMFGVSTECVVSLDGVTRSEQVVGSYVSGEMSCSLTAMPWTDDSHTRLSWDDGLSWGSSESSAVGVFGLKHHADKNYTTADYIKNGQTVVVMNKKCIAYTESSSTDYLTYATSTNYPEGVDFYAYYPYVQSSYELSTLGGFSLDNASKSIAIILNNADMSNVTSLSFALKTIESDDNIWFHDLMYSKPEDVNPLNLYGNIGKKNLNNTKNPDCDNVHLRMQHAMSRLHIRIDVDDIFINSYGGASAKVLPDIYVDGSKVYNNGHLNLITGAIAPSPGGGAINRLLDDDKADHYFSSASPYIETDLVFVPAEITGPGQFVFNLKVEGNTYSYDLYNFVPSGSTLSFLGGHRYDLNMTLSTATSIIVNQTYGGATICTKANPCDTSLDASDFAEWVSHEEDIVFYASDYKYIIVQPGDGWDFARISCNGVSIGTSDPLYVGTVERAGINCPVYRLQTKDNSKVTYRITFVPQNWYAALENISQHFDGYYNTGFSSRNATKATNYWLDLSGTGVEANLNILSSLNEVYDFSTPVDQSSSSTGYVSTQQSGWTKGGFKFNGNTDYVSFPGNLNGEQFTIDMYLCMEAPQTGFYPRIVGEAEAGYIYNGNTLNTSGFPSVVIKTESGSNVTKVDYAKSRRAHVMGLGMNTGSANGQTIEFDVPTDGRTMVHLVLRYDGGNGTLNPATGAKGSAKDNLMSFSVEYFNSSDTYISKAVFFSGNETKRDAAANEAVWGTESKAIARWSCDDAIAAFRNGLSTGNFTVTYDDGTTFPVSDVNTMINYSMIHYLEDAYTSERERVTMGGRMRDFSRNFNGTMCSFIIYDKYLTYDEVRRNFDMHVSRFGKVKSDLSTHSAQ